MKRWGESVKEKARNLRKNGRSLSEISDDLGVPKITLQWWVKNTILEKILMLMKTNLDVE